MHGVRRYTQTDPNGQMGGLAVYGYAGNSPLLYTDPTGELIPFLAIAGGVWIVIEIVLAVHDVIDTYQTVTNPCISNVRKGIAVGLLAAGLFLPGGGYSKIDDVVEVAAKKAQTLFHYTNQKGLNGILDSGSLMPSLKAVNPKDVRYGNGQYLSDIVPGSKTPAQLSREFLGQPFQGAKYTHYVEIDVSGLGVIQGRPGVFVVPNEVPLDLTSRIVSSGVVP